MKSEDILSTIAGIQKDTSACLVFISSDGYVLMCNWHTGDDRFQSWWQPPGRLVTFEEVAMLGAKEKYQVYKTAALDAFTQETGIPLQDAEYSSYFEYGSEYGSGAILLFVHRSQLAKEKLHPVSKPYIPKNRSYTKHFAYTWYTAEDAAVQSARGKTAEFQVQEFLFARIKNLEGVRKREHLDMGIEAFIEKRTKEYGWHTALISSFSVEDLCAKLDTTNDENIKEKILHAFCMESVHQGMDSACKRLLDPSSKVRALAAGLIWRCANKATPDQLHTFGPQVFSALKAESDQTVLWDQITALSQLHYTKAAPYLVTLLSHSYESARLAATGALKSMRYHAALPELQKALEKEPSEYNARWMREAIRILSEK